MPRFKVVKVDTGYNLVHYDAFNEAVVAFYETTDLIPLALALLKEAGAEIIPIHNDSAIFTKNLPQNKVPYAAHHFVMGQEVQSPYPLNEGSLVVIIPAERRGGK